MYAVSVSVSAVMAFSRFCGFVLAMFEMKLAAEFFRDITDLYYPLLEKFQKRAKEYYGNVLQRSLIVLLLRAGFVSCLYACWKNLFLSFTFAIDKTPKK